MINSNLLRVNHKLRQEDSNFNPFDKILRNNHSYETFSVVTFSYLFFCQYFRKLNVEYFSLILILWSLWISVITYLPGKRFTMKILPTYYTHLYLKPHFPVIYFNEIPFGMKFNLQLGHFLVCAPTNDVISADMSKVTCERLDALKRRRWNTFKYTDFCRSVVNALEAIERNYVCYSFSGFLSRSMQSFNAQKKCFS